MMHQTTDQGMTPDSPDSLVFEIVRELADTRGVETTDLPPLYDYVDLDALTQLLRPGGTARQLSVSCVTFSVEEYRIQVLGDGTVDISTIDNR